MNRILTGGDEQGWRVALHATRPSRVTLRLTGILAALAAFALVTACGSSDYTYVTNKGEQTYFKIPATWTELDRGALRQIWAEQAPDSLEQMIIDHDRWVVAYDAAPQPALTHLAEPVSQPVVLAIVQDLTAEEGSSLSLDDLRNLFQPVTPELRDEAKKYWEEQGVPFNVEVLNDAILEPNAHVQGVRVIYNFKHGENPLETRDLTAFVSDDRTKLYLFLLRCTTECYFSRFNEMTAIAESFTVVGRE